MPESTQSPRVSPSPFEEVRTLLPNSNSEVRSYLGLLISMAQEKPEMDLVELALWAGRSISIVTASHVAV